MRTTTSSEEILHSLVHDLRQPLGNIETSLFYLDLVLDHPSCRVREQMLAMERQVAQAAQLLHWASEELRALRSQRLADDGAPASALGDVMREVNTSQCLADDGAAASKSLARTKSATAAVT